METPPKHDVLILKFGTANLVSTSNDSREVESDRIQALAEAIQTIRQETNKKIIIVSSGAVAAGQALNGYNTQKKPSNTEKRRFSMNGWGEIQRQWRKGFGDKADDLQPAQLAHEDTSRQEFWDLIDHCFDNNDVVLLNGNDAVADDFIDNDKLTSDLAINALAQETIGSVQTVLCTDIEGFKVDGVTQSKINSADVDEKFLDAHCGPEQANPGTGSTGGMRTKARSAARIAQAGGKAHIINGLKAKNLTDLVIDKKEIGTEFI